MVFGDLGKLMKGLELTTQVTNSNPIINDNHQPRYNQSLTESTKPDSRVSGLDSIDGLLDDVNKALGITESIETPKPRPAVSQTEFVKTALNAQKKGTVDTVDPTKLPKQEPKGLINTTEKANQKLAIKGEAFKKYLVENLSTPETKHLVEAVNKIFDLMVLNKE